MNLGAKKAIIAILSIAIVVVLGWVVFTEKEHQLGERQIVVKPESAGCVDCHGREGEGGAAGRDPGIVMHWEASVHAEQGVGCVDCHSVPAAGTGEDLKNPRYVVKTIWNKSTGIKTEEVVMENGKPVERPDLWDHEGAEVVTNVSPRTCARCHETASEEFFHSRHASASQFIGSVDNFLGRFAEGPAAANSGCQQCHGSVVRLTKAASGNDSPEYSPDVWPNTGIGRVNLDGAWGSCSACHSRHEFSAEVSRRPENCGKCHMGPDHPQYEVYRESKHGAAYKKNEDEMNLGAPGGEWVLGEDYAQAPTCSSCHMGPVGKHGNYPGMAGTHDVGARISWTLRPKISIQPKGIKDANGNVLLKEPEGRRDDMKVACLTCHSDNWVNNFYVQYDQAVELYNEKYGKPLVAIYEGLKKEGLVDEVPMNEEMDYLFFEIWHHEGRRARHGASMMGPDYVQWHGFYEVTKHFYTEFLPLARELGEEHEKAEVVEALIHDVLHEGDNWEKYHRWTEGLTPEEKKTMLEWEQKTYGSREN